MMCGFVGCLYNKKRELDELVMDELVNRASQLKHRGPDDAGYFFDEYLGLGFRRLSIIDLEHGSQPLFYENKRYTIVFNGEIYNHPELKGELLNKGYTFETDSDTEIIAAMYADRNKEVVQALRGMFAFVIWDKEKKELFAARDRFGIKPFFYINTGKGIVFASEKKGLASERDQAVSQEGLQHYLTFQFVPDPGSIGEHIKRLEPGHYMSKQPGKKLKILPYWKPTFQPMLPKPFEDYVRETRAILRDSVQKHMRSDVPVGSFLSGGIDSASIVALAKEFHPDIKTFTVGFEREGFSEIDVAEDTAEKIGVENYSKIISHEEFVNELPKIIWHMDEPVADPAAVPLYFIAKEARKHVKVVLSGEGADELFGGYNIYREPIALRGFNYIPGMLRQGMKQVASTLPENMKGRNYLLRGCTPIQERYVGNAKIFNEDEKRALMTHYENKGCFTSITRSLYEQANGYHYDDVTTMQYIDLHTWLRGDILVKADNMTMASSLELRVPFLDKEVFKVASRIPANVKVAKGTTKYVLREAMHGIVPESVLYRKKLGFPVPIRHWLKNELYDWARQLVRESRTGHLFNKTLVLMLLEDHRQEKQDYSRKLWTLFVFMIWHQIFVENKYTFWTTENHGTTKQLQTV